MTSQDGTPPRSPSLSGRESPLALPRVRSPEKPLERVVRPFSEINVPFRRSNASLSAIFSSTSGVNAAKRASSPVIGSPFSSPVSESRFSSGLTIRDSSAANSYRDNIIRSFAPHVAVLPSADTEELLAQKGFPGGFLQLIRPYGEDVPGKVTIRDSTGSSKSWEDFSVRFVKLKDGLESPRQPEKRSADARPANINGYLDQYFPSSAARLRTGGDVQYVEEAVAKHLAFYESQFDPDDDETSNTAAPVEQDSSFPSAFHLLYIRRLLSGLPVSPHETFSHPVACVIAISSRNADPIEELRQLYADTSGGEHKMPQWVNNDYLRYYVLVHDEEHDDIQRSMSLFEQMKRHFGIHCHLLRVRSGQSVPSDDDCVTLPACDWLSAAEELSEIEKREQDEDEESLGPYLFESDEASVKSFVRELVTQSIVPVMERLCATWNDQVASRRRGLGGRFLSLSKKWTFGTSRSSSATGSQSSVGSNYDPVQGFYRPDSQEALLRKLADYAFMLRDFKLAQSTYELLRTDYNNDKAWKYYAGANEMCAITSLISLLPLPSKSRNETVDQMLETACYSYLTRCDSTYYALRTLAVGIELLSLRGGSGPDDAARWASRIAELELVGPVGHALFAARIAASFAARKGTGSKNWGSRGRKSALWNIIATEDWVRLDKNKQAENCLTDVFRMYHISPKDPSPLSFEGMQVVLEDLRDTVMERKGTMEAFAGAEEPDNLHFEPEEAEEELAAEKLDIKQHRKSLIGMSTAPSFAQDSQILEASQPSSRSDTPEM